MNYLKYKIYNLVSILFRPEWSREKGRESADNAVGKIMDHILLQKRVMFLEEAISVVLERHHLKGIHLVHSLN